MNTPFFTLIVVSFNAGPKLNSTLDSILTQTFEDYEIIVKDGGSDDGSIETMPRDHRIRLIRGQDHGIYDAMNQAIRSAAGEYIYFLNCGDTLHDRNVLSALAAAIHEDVDARRPGTYQKEPGAAQETSPSPDHAGWKDAIYYGDVIEMQTHQHVAANPSMTHFAMYRYLPCHQACCYAARLFSKRRFDTQYAVRADYEHFLWCVMRFGARTVYIPMTFADYEGGGFSETPEGRQKSSAEHKVITREYFTRKERFLYRLYLVATLQPVRQRIAAGEHTAALYDKMKNAFYAAKRQK